MDRPVTQAALKKAKELLHMTLLQEVFRENPAIFLKDIYLGNNTWILLDGLSVVEELFHLPDADKSAVMTLLLGVRLVVSEVELLNRPLVESTLETRNRPDRWR